MTPSTPVCTCQDQHRRGYCTEPGCPYSTAAPTAAGDRIDQCAAIMLVGSDGIKGYLPVGSPKVISAALRNSAPQERRGDEPVAEHRWVIDDRENAARNARLQLERDQLRAASQQSPRLEREGLMRRRALRQLVDIVWQHATESAAVPSTKTADMLIDKSPVSSTNPVAPEPGWLKPALDKAKKRAAEMPDYMSNPISSKDRGDK